MSDDEFNELVKRKFSEFERTKGRVPTLQELAAALGIDSRLLARKLKRAIKTLGIDNYTEGTSAFKSTLRQYLSGDILTKGVPGFADLSALMQEVRTHRQPYSELRWKADEIEYRLAVSGYAYSNPLWTLFSSRDGFLFKRITKELGDICILLQSVYGGDEVDSRLISHLSGEPVLVEEGVAMPAREYQDPIPEDQLPPNVLPFRKPYQHSED